MGLYYILSLNVFFYLCCSSFFSLYLPKALCVCFKPFFVFLSQPKENEMHVSLNEIGFMRFFASQLYLFFFFSFQGQAFYTVLQRRKKTHLFPLVFILLQKENKKRRKVPKTNYYGSFFLKKKKDQKTPSFLHIDS